MTIYGVALLAFCFLAGKIIGTLLGALLGFNGDIGGVGFAMVLLMVLNIYLKDIQWFKQESKQGILFWKNMYLPIIVAMAATQNVNAAISGGALALLVGVIATAVCFLLVPVVARIGKSDDFETT